MVDSINNNIASNALLRKQSANVITPKQVHQVLINQSANGATPTVIQPAVKTSGASAKNLPRGSLVDILT